VYPNASLALVRRKGDGALECHCGMGDETLTQDRMGPSLCCDRKCAGGKKCGGELDIDGGGPCFSVYCVPDVDDGGGNGGNDEATASNRATSRSEDSVIVAQVNEDDIDGDDDEERIEGEELEDILKEIYKVQMRTNIVSVIVVGLLVALVILVLSLIVWAWLYLDVYDPLQQQQVEHGQSAFYRKLSRKGRPGFPNQSQLPSYGATNRVSMHR